MEERQLVFLQEFSKKRSKGYDFIANNYMDFTKSELKDIILELMYNSDDRDTIEELKDRWGLYNL